MAQNWVFLNGVKINNEVFEYIKSMNYVIVFHEDEDDDPEKKRFKNVTTSKTKKKDDLYPWVAYIPTLCRICGKSICPCLRPPVRVQSLHTLVWDLFYGSTNPRKKGEDVHHRHLDKMDARIKSLGKGTKKAHGLAHKRHRQKFSARKRENLVGYFRPHLPAQVISRPELVGMSVALDPKKTPFISKKKLVRELEQRLAAFFEKLSSELSYLDSGRPIPDVAPIEAWRSPKTRMLGIHVPDLELSPGTKAFVLLNAKHKRDIPSIAAETGEDPTLLQELFKSPAVDLALRNWRLWKRLPLE